jgi:N-acetylglucosaminyldiphosphoundecaprenol N-acetyl-beta-D-mannosaminyltransferase
MHSQVSIASVSLDALTDDQVVGTVMGELAAGRGGLVITPNVDILRLLQRPENRPIAERARLAVCDGMPVLWASRLAGTPLPARVTGASLIWSLSRAAAAEGRSVYVVGGPDGAAERACEVLAREVPGLQVRGWTCPPMGFEQDARAVEQVVATVTAAGADLVFVCLGFPKQERLALLLTQTMPGAWFLGCGAAVEFVAGTRQRAPELLQRVGLEWAHRLAQEPRRLGGRYLADARFAVRLLAQALGAGVQHQFARVEPVSATAPAMLPLPRAATDAPVPAGVALDA